jgi:hypothetical protein
MESTDRRNFLSTAAVAAVATSLPVMAMAGEDPIFAAIEQHRLALNNALIATKTLGEVEKPWFAQENYLEKEPPDGLAEVDDQQQQAWREHGAALDNLLTTRPTTVAGVVAALRYVSQGRFGCHPRDGILLNAREDHEQAGQFLQMLANTLDKSA